jgi:hypothetical protein
MTTTRVIRVKCPNCQSDLDAATGNATPSEDDISVCWYCGGLLAFNKDLSVRLATQDELTSLTILQPKAWAELMRYKNGIIKRLGGIQ